MTEEHLKTQDHVVMVGEIVASRYEITRHLGTGGFAKVFRAFDQVIERDVAIKFLDLRGVPGGGAMVSTVLERFRREAKLAAKIPHRNVVNIYDIGQLDEQGFRPFIVMELLEGHDLEDQLNKHGPIRPERLLPLFVDCLDALGDAHELGIVHKDLKPSNLFLSNPEVRSESLRIVDFGIAHIKGTGAEDHEPTGDDKRLTATGQILGTLQYLTPEYIATQTVSPALDVYQMALILVELLSGERVIKTDNAFECLRIHTFGLLEVPEYLLSSTLGKVLRHALEADHNKRYATAKIFADELSKIDPRSVPVSPKFSGAETVQTRPLTSALSSPGIEAPGTGDYARPTTDGFDALPTSELEQGQAPTPARSVLPDLETRHSPLRALASNNVKTSSTSLGDLSATVRSPDQIALDDEDFPVSSSGSGKLVGVLGVLFVLILLAGGALVALMSKPDSVPEPPTAPLVTPASKPEEVVVTAPPELIPQELPSIGALDETPPGAGTITPTVTEPVEVKKTNILTPPQKRAHEVKVKTIPSDASMFLGKEKFSGSKVMIPAGEEQSSLLVVMHDGYESKSMHLTRDSTSVTIVLKKKPERIKKDPVSPQVTPPPEETTRKALIMN